MHTIVKRSIFEHSIMFDRQSVQFPNVQLAKFLGEFNCVRLPNPIKVNQTMGVQLSSITKCSIDYTGFNVFIYFFTLELYNFDIFLPFTYCTQKCCVLISSSKPILSYSWPVLLVTTTKNYFSRDSITAVLQSILFFKGKQKKC